MNLFKNSNFIKSIVLYSGLLTVSDGFAKTPKFTLPQVSHQQSSHPGTGNSVWSSMRNHFVLNHEPDRSEVNAQIALLQKHAHSLYKLLESAKPYISYVYEQTRKHGLPAELALLPIVESEFNPNAHSHAGASGLWQLMPATASDLGLKHNKAYDGRRDVVASTEAALNYLNYLHKTMKKDWLLAMAAYNTGPGIVRSATNKSSKWYKESKFWDLRLSKETTQYVPKLLALSAIIKDPARYNIKLPHISSHSHLAVKVGSSVDLKKVANSTGIGEETMRKLNPGYEDMTTTPGTPNTLLVPVDKVTAIDPVTPILAANTTTIIPNNKSMAKAMAASLSDNLIEPATVNLTSMFTNKDGETELASLTPSILTNFDVISKESAKHSNKLMKAILKQGQLLILGLTHASNSDDTTST